MYMVSVYLTDSIFSRQRRNDSAFITLHQSLIKPYEVAKPPYYDFLCFSEILHVCLQARAMKSKLLSIPHPNFVLAASLRGFLSGRWREPTVVCRWEREFVSSPIL